MGRNRNINPVNSKPLLSGLAKLGLSVDIIDNAYVVVNVPPKFRSPGLKGDTILTKLTDLIETIQAGIVPVPVEGGIIVGDGSIPSQYILIPPGTENQVLTIVGGVPVWAPNDGAGIGEAPSDGTPYSRQDAGWVSSLGQVIYDGVDTEAVILALDPTASLGQVWWAFDTKKEFTAITVAISGDVWQNTAPVVMRASNETFSLPSTSDGQTVDIGQESFVSARNIDTSATALDPKVFAVSGIDGADPTVKEIVKVTSGGISDATLFGINTTEAPATFITKITTFGTVSGVNTTAWGVNDTLYVDGVTPGEMTNVKPLQNAFIVGIVLIVDPLVGVIQVVSASSTDTAPSVLPVGLSGAYFTGDASPTVPFFENLIADPGTVATANQTVLVDDNQKLPIPIDWLSIPFTQVRIYNPGEITGNISWEVDNVNATKRVYVEIYLADALGAPIDPGNGNPIGDLGVPPALFMESVIEDPAAATITQSEVTGLNPGAFEVPIGFHLRYHVLFEKIGAPGGPQTFTMYFGSDHESLILIPARLELDDLEDVTITTPAEADVLTYEASTQLWKNKAPAAPATGGNTPIGGIIMYNGLVASIPVNWQLCDGTNGTPNMQDQFVKGTNIEAEILTSGGGGGTGSTPVPAAAHGHTGSATSTFTGSALPTHNHTASFAGSALAGHSHVFTGVLLPTHSHTYQFYADVSKDGNDGSGVVRSTISSPATSAISAGTPEGTISSVGAGTPAGTVTNTAITAGTPVGTVATTIVVDSGGTGDGSHVHTQAEPVWVKLAYIQRIT